MTCGPGMRTDATVSTRTSVTDQPNRLAMAAQTPAIIAPDWGRTSVLMALVWPTRRRTSSGLTPEAGRYLAAATFGFLVNNVSASSSESPLVSGTTLNTNTNDSPANSAYKP